MPEYFLGETGSPRSDMFSLGVITYQMLTGRLPYGAQVAKARSKSAQAGLRYDSVLDEQRDIPAWIDMVLKKAVHPDPAKRYEELSEYVYDLRHPNKAFLSKTRAPLIERSPLAFWKGVSLLLAVLVVVLLAALQRAHAGPAATVQLSASAITRCSRLLRMARSMTLITFSASAALTGAGAPWAIAAAMPW